jgi:hypothetical protein
MEIDGRVSMPPIEGGRLLRPREAPQFFPKAAVSAGMGRAMAYRDLSFAAKYLHEL